MTLSEIFKGLPPDMKFRSHVNGEIKTASQWAEEMENEKSEAKIHDSKFNYGKTILKTIYFPGVGPAFTEST